MQTTGNERGPKKRKVCRLKESEVKGKLERANEKEFLSKCKKEDTDKNKMRRYLKKLKQVKLERATVKEKQHLKESKQGSKNGKDRNTFILKSDGILERAEREKNKRNYKSRRKTMKETTIKGYFRKNEVKKSKERLKDTKRKSLYNIQN